MATEFENRLDAFIREKARNDRTPGAPSMSTMEIFQALRDMEKQEVAGRRATTGANTLRLLGGLRNLKEFTPEEASAPALSTKQKLLFEDMQTGLKGLAEARSGILTEGAKNATQRRMALSNLLSAAVQGQQILASSAASRDRTKASLVNNKILSGFKALERMESLVPESELPQNMSPELVQMYLDAAGGVPTRSASIINRAADKADALDRYKTKVESMEPPPVQGGPPVPGGRAANKVTQVEALMQLQNEADGVIVDADLFNNLETKIFQDMLSENSSQLVAVKDGNKTVITGTTAQKQFNEDRANMTKEQLQDKYGVVSIQFPDDKAAIVRRNYLDPGAIATDAKNGYQAAMESLVVVGGDDIANTAMKYLRDMSGMGEDAKAPEMLDAILGLSPEELQKNLGVVDKERAKILGSAPDIPAPVTRQTLQQELARRKRDMMREGGIVSLPENFDRKAYKASLNRGARTFKLPEDAKKDEEEDEGKAPSSSGASS
jgi:hypothetical protein